MVVFEVLTKLKSTNKMTLHGYQANKVWKYIFTMKYFFRFLMRITLNQLSLCKTTEWKNVKEIN